LIDSPVVHSESVSK